MLFLITNKLTYHTTETTGMYGERKTRNVLGGFSKDQYRLGHSK